MSEIYKNKQLVNAKSRAKEHSDKTCAESSTENATNINSFGQLVQTIRDAPNPCRLMKILHWLKILGLVKIAKNSNKTN